MDKFIPKFNPYETLTMLIPGAILVYLTLYCFHETIEIPSELFDFGIQGYKFNDRIVSSILFITISYLIGLLHHSLMNWLFSGLRNNKHLILYSVYKLETKSKYKLSLIKDYKCNKKCWYQQHIICKIYGFLHKKIPNKLCFHKRIDNFCEKGCRYFYYKYRILALLFNGIIVCISSLLGLFCNKCHCFFKDQLTDIYYDAYYYVANKGGSFSSIERQVHFIRNMFIPLILLCCTMAKGNIMDDCCLKSKVIVFIIALYFLMVERQQKVHERVFEDYEYLKRLEESDFAFKKTLEAKYRNMHDLNAAETMDKTLEESKCCLEILCDWLCAKKKKS